MTVFTIVSMWSSMVDGDCTAACYRFLIRLFDRQRWSRCVLQRRKIYNKIFRLIDIASRDENLLLPSFMRTFFYSGSLSYLHDGHFRHTKVPENFAINESDGYSLALLLWWPCMLQHLQTFLEAVQFTEFWTLKTLDGFTVCRQWVVLHTQY